MTVGPLPNAAEARKRLYAVMRAYDGLDEDAPHVLAVVDPSGAEELIPKERWSPHIYLFSEAE